MTSYNVYLYRHRETMLYFPAIEATSADDAAQSAAEQPTDDADYIDNRDEKNVYAVVVVEGNDEQYVTIDLQAEQHSVNSRLTDAAPDLFQAVSHVLAMEASGDLSHTEWDLLRRAWNKAGGNEAATTSREGDCQ